MLGTLKAWLLAAHAFPLAAVMALTGLVALASARGEPNPPKLVLLLAAMLGSQLAIGWSNDYLDRDADTLHQPWKPIAQGQVDAAKLPPAIVVALVMSAAAGISLGWLPFAFLAVGTGAGLSYNLWLKRTPFSGLPYLLALGVLPPFVWTALDVYEDEFLALYAVATPLALAAHLANVLPDLETDRAQGLRTLAVALGFEPTIAVVAACVVSAPVLAAAAGAVAGGVASFYDGAVLIPVIAVYVLLDVSAGAFYASSGRGRNREALVWAFRCVVVASVLFAGGWLAAVA